MKIRLRKINKTERDEFLNKYYIMTMHGRGGKPSPAVMEIYKNGKWEDVEIVEPFDTLPKWMPAEQRLRPRKVITHE